MKTKLTMKNSPSCDGNEPKEPSFNEEINDIFANFINVIKKYSDFTGCANSREYWRYFWLNVLITAVLSIFSRIFCSEIFSSLPTIEVPVLIFNIATIIPTIAVSVRRLNDIGKEWWYLFIPIYNVVLLAQKNEEEQQQNIKPSKTYIALAVIAFVLYIF